MPGLFKAKYNRSPLDARHGIPSAAPAAQGIYAAGLPSGEGRIKSVSEQYGNKSSETPLYINVPGVVWNTLFAADSAKQCLQTKA